MSKHNAVFSETRSDYFRPSWFISLFRGKLSLGDTFWAGTYGALMLFTPIWVGIYFIVTLDGPSHITLLQNVIYAFAMVYALLLFPATVKVALRNTTAGNWRWVAVIHNLGLAIMAVVLAYNAFL